MLHPCMHSQPRSILPGSGLDNLLIRVYEGAGPGMSSCAAAAPLAPQCGRSHPVTPVGSPPFATDRPAPPSRRGSQSAASRAVRASSAPGTGRRTSSPSLARTLRVHLVSKATLASKRLSNAEHPWGARMRNDKNRQAEGVRREGNEMQGAECGRRNGPEGREPRTENLEGGGFSCLQPFATHLIIPVTRHQKASNCRKRMRREPLLRTVRWDV